MQQVNLTISSFWRLPCVGNWITVVIQREGLTDEDHMIITDAHTEKITGWPEQFYEGITDQPSRQLRFAKARLC